MRLRYPLAVVVSVVCAFAARAAEKRPNILWLVCEDFTATYSGPYGDPLARTPNMDGLARQGVTFDQFHSTAPVCAPARSSIITGRFASSLGSQNMRSTPQFPPDVHFFPEFLRQAGYFCTNNAKTDYNTSSSWAAAWDENGRQAHWRHRKPGQPFFAVFNFEQSHESRLHERAKLVTDPAKVRVPAYLPDVPAVREDIAQYFDCVSRADAALGRVLAELKADGLENDTIVFCYSDNGGAVSRSKRFLYDNGTHTALVVYVPPALRAYASGEPGSRNAELVNFIDLAPTVLSLAGVARAPQFQGRVFYGPERAPAPRYTVMFRDRMDERYDSARAVTDGRYRYIRNYYPALPWGQHLQYLWGQASMRAWAQLARAGGLTPVQRAFFEPKPAEELFDCTTDPDNVRNLAADPAQRDTLLRMRAALRQHALATRDTGFMPEPMLMQRAKGSTPAAAAADDVHYPLTRVLDTLDRLQLAAEPQAADLRAALADPEAVIRYWGVVATWGRSLPVDVAPLLRDADALVRLAAADAVLRRGDNADAWQVLEAALQAGQAQELQLYALNVLGHLSRPVPERFTPRLRDLAKQATRAGFANYLGRAAADLLGEPGDEAKPAGEDAKL